MQAQPIHASLLLILSLALGFAAAPASVHSAALAEEREELPAVQDQVQNQAEESSVGEEPTEGASHAAQLPSRPAEAELEFEVILGEIEKVLPESWAITAIERRQVPRKWTGTAEAILIKLENPSIVIHHPEEFDYHP
ncbi:MAG: hypothetical protein V2A71_04765, partial [Candidatus Eisenbacteria bacterium]